MLITLSGDRSSYTQLSAVSTHTEIGEVYNFIGFFPAGPLLRDNKQPLRHKGNDFLHYKFCIDNNCLFNKTPRALVVFILSYIYTLNYIP